MQLQISNWSKGDIDQSIKRLISYSFEILWSFSITSSTHNFVASQHFHPQLWHNILIMIFMLHTLGLPSITLRFKSCMPQWSCCSMIFNLIHSTHYHDFCVKVQMCFKWHGVKCYILAHKMKELQNICASNYVTCSYCGCDGAQTCCKWHTWFTIGIFFGNMYLPCILENFCTLLCLAWFCEKTNKSHVLPSKIKNWIFLFAFGMFCCCIVISNPPPF